MTTAERRHPEFRTRGVGKCEWDGAIWPFASAQTLTAMANFMNNYPQTVLSDSVYFRQMELYVESQYHRGRPYIGEYLDEVTGYAGRRSRSVVAITIILLSMIDDYRIDWTSSASG